MEKSVDENKRESKCKGLIIEVKMHEEDAQQVDDKKNSFKIFQLVLHLLKLWKQENQMDGTHALNDDLIEK